MLVWARRRWAVAATRSCLKCGGSTPSAPGRLGFRTWTFSTELGIGIAIGMLAGTTGTHGSARGRMTLLAAVIGLVVGFLLDGRDSAAGASSPASAPSSPASSISDVVSGAGRREGSGGGRARLPRRARGADRASRSRCWCRSLVARSSLVGLVWLGIARHRRAQRKHAGLRVLR